ncbi:MAG: hypothetical protein IAE78_05755 [Myxococcus sp.]|nr:hypothetical protein [Myxococcus sp.]
MKTWLLAVPLLVLSVGCGPAASECVCSVSTVLGERDVACGTSLCVGPDGYACSLRGALSVSAGSCSTTGPMNPNTCTPKACNGACGSVPDGCGGALSCGGCAADQRCSSTNTCESRCAGVTCAASERCEPTTGACVMSACARAGAVCGVVDGQACGTCPGTSVCASTRQQCLETVATVPVQYVFSTALVGDRLFVTGVTSLQANGRDLYVVDLVTKQTQRLAMGTVLSPVATNGTSVFWTEAMGARRLGPGETQPTTISGLNGYCADLLVTSQHLFCGYGGSARLGVSGFGIKRVPLAGGAVTWVKEFLNSARMALGAPYLFYVGTTDNFASFATLGAIDTTDGSDQVLVSGGALDSRFIMVDADAYYFVSNQTGATLTRMPFTAAQSTDLVTSESGLSRDTTVLQGDSLFTVAKVGGVEGLWRVPVANPSGRSLVLSAADLKVTAQTSTSNLHATSGDWVFVTGSTVYRTVGAGR